MRARSGSAVFLSRLMQSLPLLFFVQTTGFGEKNVLENFKNDFLYGGIIILYKRSFFRTYIY